MDTERHRQNLDWSSRKIETMETVCEDLFKDDRRLVNTNANEPSPAISKKRSDISNKTPKNWKSAGPDQTYAETLKLLVEADGQRLI